MNNYLTHIIQRHFGNVATLQPRLPGRFEPWSIATEESSFAAPVATSSPTKSPVARSRVAPESQPNKSRLTDSKPSHSQGENISSPVHDQSGQNSPIPQLHNPADDPETKPSPILATPTITAQSPVEPSTVAPSPPTGLSTAKITVQSPAEPSTVVQPPVTWQPDLSAELPASETVINQQTITTLQQPVQGKPAHQPQTHRPEPQVTIEETNNFLSLTEQHDNRTWADYPTVNASTIIPLMIREPVQSVSPVKQEETGLETSTPGQTARAIDRLPAPKIVSLQRPPQITLSAAENEKGQPASQPPATYPTIQVTIGRVEVKATPPATTQSKPQSSKAAVMSLDDYLQQRRGENR